MKVKGLGVSLKKAGEIILIFTAAIFLFSFGRGFAQEDQAQTELVKLKWIHNDIARNIELIRKAKEDNEKRYLVEEIERIIYQEIEQLYSFSYIKQADPDFVNSGGSAESPEEETSSFVSDIAKIYALLGLARGYEGTGAAAKDNFKLATKIYPAVMDLSVTLDHNSTSRSLASWISGGKSKWGKSDVVRVNLYGGTVSGEVAGMINTKNFFLLPVGKSPEYDEYVARRDMLNKIKRYIILDDNPDDSRPNKFSIYLAPGKYIIKSGTPTPVESEFKVSRADSSNNFVIETTPDGFSIAHIDDIRNFVSERQKALMVNIEEDEPAPPPDSTETKLDSAKGEGIDQNPPADGEIEPAPTPAETPGESDEPDAEEDVAPEPSQ